MILFRKDSIGAYYMLKFYKKLHKGLRKCNVGYRLFV